MADALQVFHQHPLLGVDLLVLVQVLEHAAAAGTEMRAARRDPIRRGLQHVQRARFVEMAVLGGLLGHHPLARQRAGHEHGLAALARRGGPAGDAPAVVGQVEDLGFKGGLVDAGERLRATWRKLRADYGAPLSHERGGPLPTPRQKQIPSPAARPPAPFSKGARKQSPSSDAFEMLRKTWLLPPLGQPFGC